MLIFGASVGDWKAKAEYALDKADNEFAAVREIRCEGIEDVREAMAFMAALAADSKCKQFLYHATINLNPGERLTREQWMKAIDTLEKNLNLTGHYRVAFEHIKKDRQHYHVLWSRLPPGNEGPAVNMGNNYYKHEATAAALEKEFGLNTAPRREKDKPSRKQKEIEERNSKVRVHPDIVTKDVTKIYNESKTAKEFIKNLSDAGYTLTRSKQDKLVLVDKQGGYHGLYRRIEGTKKGDFARKFPGIEKTPMPSLSSVLRSRRPATAKAFKKAAVGAFVRPRKRVARGGASFRTGHNPYFAPSRTRSLASILGEARARYYRSHEDEKKNYPPPVMRKRRRKKKDENKPEKRIPNKAEIERAEAIRKAWEEGRYDILALYGIIVLPEHPTHADLIRFGLIPPDTPEP